MGRDAFDFVDALARVAAAIGDHDVQRRGLQRERSLAETADPERSLCVALRAALGALERGIRRMDFLRGDEPYKYEWGAVDEPIQRLLVRRDVEAPG